MALRNVAKVFTWAGKKEEANKLALRAAELVGGDAETYVLAGNALLKKGEAEAAVEQSVAGRYGCPGEFVLITPVPQALNALETLGLRGVPHSTERLVFLVAAAGITRLALDPTHAARTSLCCVAIYTLPI